jgi:hypothetical protein
VSSLLAGEPEVVESINILFFEARRLKNSCVRDAVAAYELVWVE